MPTRVDTAPVLAAASALLLLVSLFLDWFTPDDSAWTAFEAWDLVLAAVAVGAIAASIRALGLVRAWPRRADGLLPLLGGVALVIVASQLLNPPPNAQDRELEVGAWLAFVAAVGLAVAGVLSAARVSFEVSFRSRRPGEVGAASPGAGAPGPPRAEAEGRAGAGAAAPEDEPTAPLGDEPPAGRAPPREPPPAAEPPAPGEAPEPGRRPGDPA